jgi:glycosyltransferase involved in cell wall biosynthesis
MPAYLLLVGDGVMRPKMEALLKELNLTEYVKMTGLQRKVLPYYQAADLFTLVSKNVETFSIAALEAMSCGLPLVLTNVGGAEEMVSSGVNGFLTGEDESDIAMGWLKGIQGNFDRHQIHDYAVKHFRKDKMTQAYKSLMELP